MNDVVISLLLYLYFSEGNGDDRALHRRSSKAFPLAHQSVRSDTW